tara:strand:+ start:48974 stop:49912 length:939 start_codon:yes stop_codon:yes gene_type:complete
MKKLLLTILSITIFSFFSFSQTTIILEPDKDNTLYESNNGSLSNGSGSSLFFGQTNSNLTRRAVVKFRLDTLPSNIIVTNVRLSFKVSRVNNTSPSNASIHVLTNDWGEGSSVATGQGGGGASSATNDATWIHTFFNTATWNNAGGDFDTSSSASSSVGSVGTNVVFSSTQMVSDVQQWIDSSSTNFGWIVLGDESSSASAKRVHSREATNSADRPILTITYIATTGLEKEVGIADEIMIGPIPANEFINLDYNASNFFSEGLIISLEGKKVMNVNLDNSKKIDIASLSKGIYFIQLRSLNGDFVTKKFIKN